MPGDTTDTSELLRRAGRGDSQALGDLFDRHRDRLRRMVQIRLDRRLQGRIDPSDVLQEAYLEVARGLAGYLSNPVLPFFLWLRFLTGMKLHALHRHHLGTKARDAGREVSLHAGALPQASSASLPARRLGRFTTASPVALRAERQLHLQAILNGLDELDREILALRHFEGLSNGETAQVLGLSETAANNRYVRALGWLCDLLGRVPGFLDQG